MKNDLNAQCEGEALRWWLLAVGQGSQPATEQVPNLQRSLSPDQIAEAEKRARQFMPHQ